PIDRSPHRGQPSSDGCRTVRVRHRCRGGARMTTVSALPALRLPRLRKRIGISGWDVLPLLFLVVVAATIAVPNVIAPYDPLQENPDLPLATPSGAHPFGTDYIGRDLLSRVVAGTAATIAG